MSGVLNYSCFLLLSLWICSLFHTSVETPWREVAYDCKVVANRHPTMSEKNKNNNCIASFSLTINTSPPVVQRCEVCIWTFHFFNHLDSRRGFTFSSILLAVSSSVSTLLQRYELTWTLCMVFDTYVCFPGSYLVRLIWFSPTSLEREATLKFLELL